MPLSRASVHERGGGAGRSHANAGGFGVLLAAALVVADLVAAVRAVAVCVVPVRAAPVEPQPAAVTDVQASAIASIRLNVIVLPDGGGEQNLPAGGSSLRGTIAEPPAGTLNSP